MQLTASRYGALLSLFRCRCSGIVESCALLMRAIVEQADLGTCRAMQSAALSSGVWLRHFFNACFATSQDQRFVSRYLLELWSAGNSTAREVLRHVLPAGLLLYLDMPKMGADQSAQLEAGAPSNAGKDMSAAAAKAQGMAHRLRTRALRRPPGVAVGPQLDRPPGLGLLAGPGGQAGRGRCGRRFGWGGARPRQAPARALRSPGGALPWCCGCVRARARVLALSTFSTGEYDSCDGFRIGYAVTGGRHFHLRPWQVYCILECSRPLAARAHFGINLGSALLVWRRANTQHGPCARQALRSVATLFGAAL
jgi:hypothetical protein